MVHGLLEFRLSIKESLEWKKKKKILGWYIYKNGRNVVFGKHWGQRHYLSPFILIYVSDDKEADG